MKSKNVTMKTKYERLNKEEKKKLLNEFKTIKKDLYNKMIKMFIFIVLGILYSLIMFIFDVFYKFNKVGFILDIIVFVFCIIALLKVISIKKDLLNRFLLKKDSK